MTATNLGPTRLVVEPGKPFPQSPLQEVNSPLDVLINGQPAEVVNKFGWPAGTAALRLTAAWISGSEVKIPVQ